MKLIRFSATLLFTLSISIMLACGSSDETTNAYKGARPAADEASALLTLKTIATAQQSYFARNGSYGSFDQLADASVIDGRFRGAAPTVNGYVYTMTVTPAGSATPSFSVNADPQANANRPTGTKHYFMDTSGTVHYNETQKATATDPPAPQ